MCFGVISRGYIINQDIAVFFAEQERAINGSDNSFFMLETVFSAIAFQKDFCAYNIVGNVMLNNTKRQKSTWRHKNKLLEIWAKAWCETINRLPPIYDEQKKYVKLSNDLNLNYFAITHLLNFRAEGDFCLSSIRKNKKYIPEITNTSVFWFYFIAILPRVLLLGLKDIALILLKKQE